MEDILKQDYSELSKDGGSARLLSGKTGLGAGWEDAKYLRVKLIFSESEKAISWAVG